MAAPNPKAFIAAQWEFHCEQVAAFENLVATVDANAKYFQAESACPACTVPAVRAVPAEAHTTHRQCRACAVRRLQYQCESTSLTRSRGPRAHIRSHAHAQSAS